MMTCQINKHLTNLAVFLILMISSTCVFSKGYYVDNLTGNDLNAGDSTNAAWKSLQRVNSFRFNPGDIVYLRKGQVWNETLIVSSSGTKHKSITYTSYGSGLNPVIKTSITYNNWTLETSKGNIKIWKGQIHGHSNYWSAFKDGHRVPVYFGYETEGHQKLYTAPMHLTDMRDGFFYSPLNKDVFYYRSDAGYPGEFEIGALRYAIYIKAKSFVTIDGIDTFGPGGQAERGSATGSAHVVVERSDHIVIRNSRHSHNHNNGIRIADGSHHCTVDNVISNGHRSTGIYLWEAGQGNIIKNSEVYDCGTVISDTGDMGLIGVWETDYSVIKGCNVHDNGHDNIDGMDAAISIVRSKNTTVMQNLVNNVGGTGIMIASDSDYSSVAYNVVKAWGKMGGAFKTNRHCDGIKIGGGPAKSVNKHVGVYNNLIMNGDKCGKNRAALHISRQASPGLDVKNNIIFDNGINFDFIADKYMPYPQWSFQRNIIYNVYGDSIRLNNQVFKNNGISKTLSKFSADKVPENAVTLVPPRLDLKNNSLLPDSPAVDNGSETIFMYDFHGNPVPQGNGYDIGPFEYTETGNSRSQ